MKNALASALAIATLTAGAWGKTFKEHQLEFPQVRQALDEHRGAVGALFQKAGVPFPPRDIFLRVFKRERTVELWARGDAEGAFKMVKVYALCTATGALGPKRSAGDGRVPEGFYRVDRFDSSPGSRLGLVLDFPNASDRVHVKKDAPIRPVSLQRGCDATGDLGLPNAAIGELYAIAVETFSAHGTPIQAHLFPTALGDEAFASLEKSHGAQPALVDFWRNLKDGYDFFEADRKLPEVLMGKTGKYRFIP